MYQNATPTRCDSTLEGKRCGLPLGHNGLHTALIPTDAPWFPGVNPPAELMPTEQLLEPLPGVPVELAKPSRYAEREAETSGTFTLLETITLLRIGAQLAKDPGTFDLLEEAAEDFLKAIQFNPTNENAYNNIATVFCKQGDYEQALRYLNNALALSKKMGLSHADLYNNLGFIYMKKGMHKEAMDAYNHAVRITKSKSANDAGLCDQIEFEQRIEGHSVIGKFYGQ